MQVKGQTRKVHHCGQQAFIEGHADGQDTLRSWFASRPVNTIVRDLLTRIAGLEEQLARELHAQGEHLQYRVVGKRVEFSHAVAQAQRKLRMGIGHWLLHSRPQSVLTVPFIYAMIVPLVLLDLSFTCYQLICFPLYGIPRVRRGEYLLLDRHRLPYLNAIEKIHCAYCSYANGLLAYAREVAARTEQYWCPIKHSQPQPGAHGRYAGFLDFGDPIDFHARVEAQRKALAQAGTAMATSVDSDGAPP